MVYKLPSFLTAGQLADISFLNGLDQNNAIVITDFWGWNGNNPATYSSSNETAHKWGGGAAGTVGTVRYYFDTGSLWTATEQSAFLGAMALWSDEAGVKFTLAASEASAQLLLFRYGSSTAATYGITLSTGYYETDNTSSGTVGGTTLGTLNVAYISAQTQNITGYGDITSFSTYGGYGIDSIVHEMGHAIGLGHAGPYNGNVNSATQQYNAYDSRLYSVMSYINPTDTSAKYYNSYAVTGTNWGATSDHYLRAPYTPMQDDIGAAQQLYGVSSGTSLNQTQTFGFNTTLASSDPVRPYFDFTVDTAPVITLFDTAPGNTLDLSGYHSSQTIDLLPGTFSSVGGLTNNLSIDGSTAIDNVIGGSGSDRIIVNADADTINGGSGGTDVVVFPLNKSAYGFTPLGNAVDVTANGTGVVDWVSHVTTLQFADQSISYISVQCFVTGTRIATPGGEAAVETLAVGDEVLLADGRTLPVRWLGRQTVSRRFADPLHGTPIRIRAGALGGGLPRRDLLVSPGHGLALDGVLAQAGALVNGVSIVRETAMAEVFQYWHIALDEHALLLAEGAAAESYLPDAEEVAFDNLAERPALDFGPQMELPRVKAARQVPMGLRARLGRVAA